MQVSIYRYNPETDDRPYMSDYTVEIPEGRDLMVLDVMALIKEQDASVTYRRSCREGVCGSDGVNMNGKNGLACITPVSEVARGGKLKLRPLPGLPVIRDLVVDMTQFYDNYKKVQPYLINDTLPPKMERLQSPEDREKLDGLYECILCACCSTSLFAGLTASRPGSGYAEEHSINSSSALARACCIAIPARARSISLTATLALWVPKASSWATTSTRTRSRLWASLA